MQPATPIRPTKTYKYNKVKSKKKKGYAIWLTQNTVTNTWYIHHEGNNSLIIRKKKHHLKQCYARKESVDEAYLHDNVIT